MHRTPLLQLLDAHSPYDEHEQLMLQRMRDFIIAYAGCFERALSIGHMTGSAWILNTDKTHVLLTHHRKLEKWLQLGGHADGDADLLRVALREAREESGLNAIAPLSKAIFDVDIHAIPARGAEAEHFHYDVRFLLQADRAQPLSMNHESKELIWVPLEEVARLNGEESMRRMVVKSRKLL